MLPVREIYVSDIIKAVRNLCIDSNYYLGKDIKNKLKQDLEDETWPIAKDVLEKLLENAQIAELEGVPMCQDTGMACIFVSIGQGKSRHYFRGRFVEYCSTIYLDLVDAVRMMNLYPNRVVGFDLVDQEDRYHTLLYYLQDFLDIQVLLHFLCFYQSQQNSKFNPLL